jgi:DNA-binding NarL/FixJ family response regulator
LECYPFSSIFSAHDLVVSAVKDTTPVIFITAYDEPEVRAQAEACGCAGYFRKTASGADVLTAIRRAIDLKDSKSGCKPGNPNSLGRSQ